MYLFRRVELSSVQVVRLYRLLLAQGRLRGGEGLRLRSAMRDATVQHHIYNVWSDRWARQRKSKAAGHLAGYSAAYGIMFA